MSKFKVGDKVRINSPRAKSHGMIGEIELGEWDGMIGVYVAEMNKTLNFSSKNLMKLENSKIEEQKGEKKLGFFSMNNFNFSGEYAFDDDILSVKAYTVEHCLKIHDRLQHEGKIDPYEFLFFDGQVYEIETEMKIVSHAATLFEVRYNEQ